MSKLLTIGMIVKNEEKDLKRCLDSVRPLLDIPEVELIITDTGSTDKTVEIAKEYTENILYFNWINDFSAARNAGISKAKGKWFLRLDADQYFETEEAVKPIADFFLSGEYKKYSGAFLTIIDAYFDEEAEKYHEFRKYENLMLFEVTEKSFFKGEIHENVEVEGPVARIKATLQHTGYDLKDEKDILNKLERNIKPLLEEYEKDPSNLRTIWHILSQYFFVKDYAKVSETYKTSEDVIMKNQDSAFFYGSNVMYISALFSLKDYKGARDKINDLIEGDDGKHAQMMDIYNISASIFFNLGSWERALIHIEKYLEYYDYFSKNSLDMEAAISAGAMYLNESQHAQGKFHEALIFFQMGEEDKAIEVFASIDDNNIEFVEIKEYWTLFKGMFLKTKEAKYLNIFIGKLEICYKAKQKKHIDELIATLEEIAAIVETSEYKELQKALIKNESKWLRKLEYTKYEQYRGLMEISILVGGGYEKNEDSKTLFESLLAKTSYLEPWPELLLLGMKFRTLETLSTKVKLEKFEKMAKGFIMRNENGAELIYQSLSDLDLEGSLDTIGLQRLSIELILVALSKNSNKSFEEANKVEMLEWLCILSEVYMSIVYKEEALKEENFSILPRFVVLAIQMARAKELLAIGNVTEYVKEMTKGAKHCIECAETIKAVVKRVTKELEEEARKAKTINTEMQKLAQGVKSNLKFLISENKIQEANLLLKQYKAVNPSDEDIILLENTIKNKIS